MSPSIPPRFVRNSIVRRSHDSLNSSLFSLLTRRVLDVFVVVRPVKENGQTSYQVEWSCKPGVPPFKPFETAPGLYEKSRPFKARFLTKRKFLLSSCQDPETFCAHSP